jgi:hypothetical protein
MKRRRKAPELDVEYRTLLPRTPRRDKRRAKHEADRKPAFAAAGTYGAGPINTRPFEGAPAGYRTTKWS